MLCSKCSHEIESDVPFCKYCGAKIEEPEVVEKTIANVEDQSLNEIYEENIKDLNKTAQIKKIFIKSKSKTIAFIASFAGILVVIAIVIVMISSNPVNKFLDLLIDGKTTEAYQLYNSEIKGNPNNESKVKETASKRIESIQKKYISENTTYADTISELNKFTYLTIVSSEYESAKKIIDDLNNSRIAYLKAVEYEKNKDYNNAIQQYYNVIEVDKNYSSACERIDNLKGDYKSAILSEVESLEETNQYSIALDKVNQALNILSNDADFIAKKEVLSEKVEAEKAAKEAAEREKQKVFIGKTVNASGLNVTYKKASLATKILPDNINGAYLYYSCDNDEIYLDLVYLVKNDSNYSMSIGNIFSDVIVEYNESNKYTSYSCFYTESPDDISAVYSWENLESLDSTTYHLTVTLPREVTNTSYPITIEYTVGGEKQYLKFR